MRLQPTWQAGLNRFGTLTVKTAMRVFFFTSGKHDIKMLSIPADQGGNTKMLNESAWKKLGHLSLDFSQDQPIKSNIKWHV